MKDLMPNFFLEVSVNKKNQYYGRNKRKIRYIKESTRRDQR